MYLAPCGAGGYEPIGHDDVKLEADKYHILCDPENYSAVSEALESAGIPIVAKEITRVAQNTVQLDSSTARTVLKLLEALDDHDDVQNVSANFDVDDNVLAELTQGA